MDQITLFHKREGYVYEGRIEGDGACLREFNSETFGGMLHLLSDSLNFYPFAVLVFQRTDRVGLMPVTLETEMRDLIRKDPEEAAEKMSPPPRTVMVDTEVKVSARASVRTGHDTLADSFGDKIYMRLEGDKIEFPFDGRWKSFTSYDDSRNAGWEQKECLQIPEYMYKYPHKRPSGPWISPWKVSSLWAVIPTTTLLDVGEEQGITRYYLPRAWNESGGWISHENLKKMYDDFLEERKGIGA